MVTFVQTESEVIKTDILELWSLSSVGREVDRPINQDRQDRSGSHRTRLVSYLQLHPVLFFPSLAFL